MLLRLPPRRRTRYSTGSAGPEGSTAQVKTQYAEMTVGSSPRITNGE